MRKIVRRHLEVFTESMPDDFDLRGASIGNLALTAGYLENRGHLDPMIFVFSKLVEVRGVVRPVVNDNLHLAAELENGRAVFGQHLISGKENGPIESPVRRLYLVDSLAGSPPAEVSIRDKMAKLIRGAGLICYPMGSFYSSLVANLLPGGVSDAIAANPCPKVYAPSTGTDPETRGMDLTAQVETLLGYLGAKNADAARRVLNYVIVDKENGDYPGPIDEERLSRLGVRVLDFPLVTGQSDPDIDERILAPLLLSLA